MTLSTLKDRFKIFLLRVKRLLFYGPNLKLVTSIYDSKFNKIIKHTGIGHKEWCTHYFSSTYHYSQNIPRIFNPTKYDCLIAQSFLNEEMVLFSGPKLFYTLEPLGEISAETTKNMKNLEGRTQCLTFHNQMKGDRLFYPVIKNLGIHLKFLESHIATERSKLCCIVNRYSENEKFDLLPQRINYVEAFQPSIDIYGKKPWNGENKWESFKNYKGPTAIKQKTLKSYNFNLCFENSDLDGYITEKIIQALLAGTIPLYWGGGAFLSETIPSDCFINCKDQNPKDILKRIKEMPFSEIVEFRKAGLRFLKSDSAKFFNSLYYRRSILNKIETQF